jgi:Fur family transcriptional regulator, ferric uptake regulator
MSISELTGSAVTASSDERSEWAEQTMSALSRLGFRDSSGRRQVIWSLARAHGCLDAQQVFDRLRAEGQRVGIATVYRTLDLLSERGYLQRIDLGAGAASYEPVFPGERNHHLICTCCGRVERFNDSRLESVLDTVEQQAGYLVAAREIVLRGLCGDCRDGRAELRNAAR